MNVGITFNLKQSGAHDSSLPDDAQEEFDSPETIEALASVLRGMGHHVTLLGDGREFLEKVLASPPDFVFNYAEGTGISRSREARAPAVLEMLGIPFSGSDPLTMAVTLDKDIAKTIVAAAGVNVARGYALGPTETLSQVPADRLIFPLVAKPAWEGSSKGIRSKCLVKNPTDLPAVVADLRRDHRQTILLEEFIAGDELTVGVLGNEDAKVIGAMRVVPLVPKDDFIYSLEIKREWQANVRYEAPPKLGRQVIADLEAAALKAYRALGCRDVSRIDFRVRGGVPYFLEVNPLPGLSPVTSDLMILAKGACWTYETLVAAIVETSLRRVGLAT